MREYALIRLNVIEYTGICLKNEIKKTANYVKILNVPDVYIAKCH